MKKAIAALAVALILVPSAFATGITVKASLAPALTVCISGSEPTSATIITKLDSGSTALNLMYSIDVQYGLTENFRIGLAISKLSCTGLSEGVLYVLEDSTCLTAEYDFEVAGWLALNAKVGAGIGTIFLCGKTVSATASAGVEFKPSETIGITVSYNADLNAIFKEGTTYSMLVHYPTVGVAVHF